jgi:hypothetical protein
MFAPVPKRSTNQAKPALLLVRRLDLFAQYRHNSLSKYG